ncbi:ROK family transcriptional regulator [Cellulomonas marina]|uniref:Sugar kinase of the NBD/HSP70 family, may contain an N-terminal HTH domain n=1 Tax=Cellulomonas marina TaxID=988821 RepID=A0A1I0Z9V7_9CELL|nr:ROK family protein [Cellulomonas marina]SFB22192.1 Sugar kinase of the NBD/HSP70 family, may contain an N-terminal HTH domain [Cellulomonas marina]
MATSAPRAGDLSATLQLLRDGRPRTRAELATLSGQARSTVAMRVDQLLSSGLVAPTGEAASTGGRPPATFAFNPAARVVLAVDLGATHARVAVTDLAATVLAEHLEVVAIAEGPEVVLDLVARVAHDLLARTGRSASELVGVGVGLPGPVDHETGRPTNPPIMPGWDGADVAGRLQELLGPAPVPVPVLVDNDVNVMALGEHAAEFRDVDHLLFVKVATGIGAGIISDGGIRRGAQGAAGDLGHVAVPGGPAVVCRCGNTGCLEAVASGRAVAAELAAHGLAASTSTEAVALVRAGDLTATAAVREAGRRLGSVLAVCVSMLNPSVIVIGGSLAEAGEHLLAGIREVVYRRSLPLATQHLRIVTSRTGGRAGVLGASTMAIEHVLAGETLDALI